MAAVFAPYGGTGRGVKEAGHDSRGKGERGEVRAALIGGTRNGYFVGQGRPYRANLYDGSAYIGKLDKMYERKQIHRNADGITAVEYEVPEKLISFRSGIVKKNLTDEQKTAFVERMKKTRKRDT